MDISWTDKKCYWIALHLIPGLGNVACKNLIDIFKDPENIFQASRSDLKQVKGLRKNIAQLILDNKWSADPLTVMEKAERIGARIITIDDSEYPSALKQVHDPPFVLYIKGKKILPGMTYISMVGSRNPTHYGLKASETISQGLSRRGVGIVSGMAKGIDSAAHWGAIGGKGFTIGVLGTGIDKVYPASNRELFHRVVQEGAIISEFPLGTPPEARNFPIRNRIIAGISRGVVVVEANKKSGSLITASFALEQGRDVLAVPGSIDSFKSRGCHFLIKQGAALVENSDDIMNELGLNYKFAAKTDTFAEHKGPALLDEPEQRIYDQIGDYPIHIDLITKRSLLDPGEVSGILTKMEIKGLIRQLPGKMFAR